MNALITGATGFVGNALARRLLQDGWEVTLVVRPTSNLEKLKSLEKMLDLVFFTLEKIDSANLEPKKVEEIKVEAPP